MSGPDEPAAELLELQTHLVDDLLTRARALARVRDVAGDRDLVSDRARELVEVLESVRSRVGELVTGPRGTADPADEPGLAPPVPVTRPARAAVRVSRWAVRLSWCGTSGTSGKSGSDSWGRLSPTPPSRT